VEIKVIEADSDENFYSSDVVREYDPKYCGELISFCKNGYMPIMFSGYKNIPIEVFAEWQREHQEFNDAWQIAEMADVLTWQQRLIQSANASSSEMGVDGMGYDIRVCEKQLVLREKVLLKSADNKGLTSTPKEIYSRSSSSNTRRKDLDVAEQMKKSVGNTLASDKKKKENNDKPEIYNSVVKEPDYLSEVIKLKINSDLVVQ